MSNVLNQIKALLGIEVKLEQIMLVDGVTAIEAEVFEAGQSVFIINGEDRIPMPVGEYEMENGILLVVAQEGVIAEIKELPAEEEQAPMEQPTPEVPVEAEAAPATPKRVIESVVKEQHFSKEEIDALKSTNESLKKEIEDLKTELASLKQVEEEVELYPEPLTHNPEQKNEVKLNLYGTSRPKTTFDSVLSKIVK